MWRSPAGTWRRRLRTINRRWSVGVRATVLPRAPRKRSTLLARPTRPTRRPHDSEGSEGEAYALVDGPRGLGLGRVRGRGKAPKPRARAGERRPGRGVQAVSARRLLQGPSALAPGPVRAQ